MQRTQFVRVMGLLLVLGLAGSVVGCGLGAEQGPTAEELSAQKAIRAEIRTFQKKQFGGTAGAAKGGALRGGKSRARLGP
jgi:hypothetical protein